MPPARRSAEGAAAPAPRPRAGGAPAAPRRAAAGEVLHDVEVPTGVLADAVDRDEVGVVQPAGGPGLAAASRQVGRLAEQLPGDVLDQPSRSATRSAQLVQITIINFNTY